MSDKNGIFVTVFFNQNSCSVLDSANRKSLQTNIQNVAEIDCSTPITCKRDDKQLKSLMISLESIDSPEFIASIEHYEITPLKSKGSRYIAF